MHFSCLTAGTLLSRLGRPEVMNCIAGLKQYNYAYEEAGEEAIEMERSYTHVLNGESDVNHMASVVLIQHGAGAGAGAVQQHGQEMAMDHSPTSSSYGQTVPSHQDPNAVSLQGRLITILRPVSKTLVR